MLNDSVADAVLRAVPPFCNDLDRYLEGVFLHDLSELVGVLFKKIFDLVCACHDSCSFLMVQLLLAFP